MAYKPKRVCKHPGCCNLTSNGYCDSHTHMSKEQSRSYDKYLRNKEADAFYHSKEWKAVRNQVIMRDKGLCVQCLKSKVIKQAEAVDHIIPLKVAWQLRLTMSNLQSLCDTCHNKKTAADLKKYKK